MTDTTGVTGEPKLSLDDKVETILDVLARQARLLQAMEAEVYSLRFAILFGAILAGALYMRGKGVSA